MKKVKLFEKKKTSLVLVTNCFVQPKIELEHTKKQDGNI